MFIKGLKRGVGILRQLHASTNVAGPGAVAFRHGSCAGRIHLRMLLRVVAVGSKGGVQGCSVDWGWRRQRWAQSRGRGGVRAVPESVHRAVQRDRKNTHPRAPALPSLHLRERSRDRLPRLMHVGWQSKPPAVQRARERVHGQAGGEHVWEGRPAGWERGGSAPRGQGPLSCVPIGAGISGRGACHSPGARGAGCATWAPPRACMGQRGEVMVWTFGVRWQTFADNQTAKARARA